MANNNEDQPRLIGSGELLDIMAQWYVQENQLLTRNLAALQTDLEMTRAEKMEYRIMIEAMENYERWMTVQMRQMRLERNLAHASEIALQEENRALMSLMSTMLHENPDLQQLYETDLADITGLDQALLSTEDLSLEEQLDAQMLEEMDGFMEAQRLAGEQ